MSANSRQLRTYVLALSLLTNIGAASALASPDDAGLPPEINASKGAVPASDTLQSEIGQQSGTSQPQAGTSQPQAGTSQPQSGTSQQQAGTQRAPLQGRADMTVEQYSQPVPSNAFSGTAPNAVPYGAPRNGRAAQIPSVPYQMPPYGLSQPPPGSYNPWPSQPAYQPAPYMVPQNPNFGAPPYAMPPLQGSVQSYAVPPGQTSQFAPPGTSQADQQKPLQGTVQSLLKTLLSGGINKQVPPAERPWWIPGYAYTNDAMVAPYHNMDIMWWDKRAMPNHPQRVILSTSVTRYWGGFAPDPCYVMVEPFPQAPGNFTFRSLAPGGPRGWLQALNDKDFSGFPLYRYWFDHP